VFWAIVVVDRIDRTRSIGVKYFMSRSDAKRITPV
jgi:hypothetical protein